MQKNDSWNLAFPSRLTPPEITGTIRRKPEDFEVSEVLAAEPTGEGEHLYLEIEKRDANTSWVAWQLAEVLGVREQDIGYAGRKDRHAVTRQWFSAYMPGRETPDLSALAIEGVSLIQVTRHRAKLRQGEIRENRFVIRVACHASSDAVNDMEQRLASIRQAGFPNYFGPQRFGRDGANLEGADRLLRCREKVKGDRGMLISAARAWLFNLYLADEIRTGNDLKDATGPLIGKSRDPQPGEERLDETMQAWVAGLRRLGSKVDSRPLAVVPGDLQWVWTDESLRLSFSLPAGAFATSLLQEVFVLEDASQ